MINLAVDSNPKTYEECSEVIDSIIQKFQRKWQLKAINWFDFEDVSQVIKLHIFNKWHLWDQTKALEPWVATVARNQIRNTIRNNYTNYVKPCMQCRFNMGDNLCAFTKNGVQNMTCDPYAKWSKQKKSGYGLKLPLPMENHTKEIDQHEDTSIDFDDSIQKLNTLLKESLSDVHYKVYIMLFFEHKTDEEIAAFMGYKTNEKNRKAGYKQIKNIKKMLKEKAESLIAKNDIIS